MLDWFCGSREVSHVEEGADDQSSADGGLQQQLQSGSAASLALAGVGLSYGPWQQPAMYWGCRPVLRQSRLHEMLLLGTRG